MLTLKLQSACATALTVVQAAVRTTGQVSLGPPRAVMVGSRLRVLDIHDPAWPPKS